MALKNRSVRSVFWLCGPGLVFLAFMFGSCGNTRHLTYMQGQFDTARLSQINVSDPIIQKGDILSIIVYSDNPQATALYNQSIIITPSAGGGDSKESGGSSGGFSGASPTTPGYLVDELGNIQFQSLGVLHVEGLTRGGVRALLDSSLKNYLKNPYYTIRFLNYKFTMLGEVARQGVYSIPGDHVNLLEAIGMAGDLTFYGRRDNVLIIRVNNGKREYARLDLTKPEIMASPYFYLQQNDVVYVEQNRKKVAANDQVTYRNITIGTSLVSVIALLYTIIRNK
ncbi:MAG: polysaccharide biosynthesis/export family protein [Chitinophagaceae bacterium]|nr:polysaccharide biosynthesis/export family protein [Chitinophagaceae bacterium]